VQRHRLALLALLGLSGERAVSRDKVLAYLWPERDATHGRQLLNQAVHNLRRALGEDALLSVGDELRLNREIVSVDVADFDRALGNGAYEDAVRLYAGPFLDGFFLGNAPELEQWAQRERERLAGAYAKALEALAEAAEKQGDHRGAVERWKTLAAHEPYDSRLTLRLMRALVAAGNRAGALQQAAVHERLLRDAFGVEPRPDVLALAQQLRQRPEKLPAEASPPHPPEEFAPVARPAPSPAPPDDARLHGSEPHSAARAPRAVRRWRRWALASLVAASALLIVVLVTRRAPSAATASEPAPSIAVLPLAILGSDPGEAALADAMTEALISGLAKNEGVRVVARTSAFAFRDRRLDIRQIAESLRVRHLLEGSLQRSGDRLRVRVHLIDARDGATRWSETYDRDMHDVFAVEDEIAERVAAEMGLRLGAGRRHGAATPTIAAYELYLRATDPTVLRSDSAARAALANLEQAVAIDASYAAAHAAIARLRLRVGARAAQSGARSGSGLPSYVTRAEEEARRAIALDDSLADGYASLALVLGSSRAISDAEERLDHAMQLDPGNALYLEWLVRLHAITGRPDDALRAARRAVDIDPLSSSARAELARALLVNGRPDEALSELDRLAAVRPPLLRAAALRAYALLRTGRRSEAATVMRSAPTGGRPAASGVLGDVLARGGDRAAALRIRDTLIGAWRDGSGGAAEIAVVSLGLGDVDQTFVWLDRAVDDYSLHAYSELTPPLDELYGDPRYERVLARLGYQKR
jgi:serine/threonine-protein kinase